MRFDPIFIYANYAEAGFWAVLGLVAFFRSRSRSGKVLAIALLAFGISDIVETRTGAWYQPWWMLAWKSVCVIAIVGVGLNMMRRRSGG